MICKKERELELYNKEYENLLSELDVNIKSTINNLRFENTAINKLDNISDQNNSQHSIENIVLNNSKLIFIGLSQNNCNECKEMILHELRELCKTTSQYSYRILWGTI
jgi:hypothetical protein